MIDLTKPRAADFLDKAGADQTANGGVEPRPFLDRVACSTPP